MKRLKHAHDVQRRDFLKTLTSSGISMQALKALPFSMGVLASRQAMAATPSGISRVLFVYLPDGAPPGTYTFGADGTLGDTAEPLEEVKDDIIIFEGMETGGKGHNDAGIGIFAGANNRPDTYDTLLETNYGRSKPFSALYLGIESAGKDGIGKRAGEPVQYEDNPIKAFNAMFGGDVDVSGEGPKRFHSVLDNSLEELKAIQAKLGVDERQRLESHIEQINRAKVNFDLAAANATLGCKDLTQNTYDWNGELIGHFTKLTNMQSENILLAFKCGLTNIATLHLSNNQAEFTPVEPTDDDYADLVEFDTFHTALHSFGIEENKHMYPRYRRYMSEQLKYMIKLLKNEPDPEQPGKSLLDTTMVMQVTCMGN